MDLRVMSQFGEGFKPQRSSTTISALKLSGLARNKKGMVDLQYKCSSGVAFPFGGATLLTHLYCKHHYPLFFFRLFGRK